MILTIGKRALVSPLFSMLMHQRGSLSEAGGKYAPITYSAYVTIRLSRLLLLPRIILFMLSELTSSFTQQKQRHVANVTTPWTRSFKNLYFSY
ncbi:hypothetical protein PUN28_013199 [Cardiocondyla obscurior]|uniref:Uncharacterized protein n=1 Tax=Cardiocondyla obscurior TaxID=286306 RepID=A0AAW2FBG1_9HYME